MMGVIILFALALIIAAAIVIYAVRDHNLE